MMRIGLFLGTNLAIIALISLTFRLLGFEGLLQANGVDLNLTALLVYSAVIGFAGSFISLFLSKSMTKASMGVTIIDQPRNETERWIMATVKSQADRAGIAMPEVGIFDHPSPNAFATGWNKNAALVAVSTGLLGSMERGEVEAVLAHEVQPCRQRRYGHLGAYPGCREYLRDFPVAGRWLLGRPIGLQGATRPRTSLLDRLDDRRVRLRHSRNDNRDVVLPLARIPGRRRRRGTRRPAKHDQCLETPSSVARQTRPTGRNGSACD